MTRKEFLQKYFVRFAVILILCGLTVYVIAHALGDLSGSLVTTPVREVTDTRLTSATAYLFREEALLTAPHKGLLLPAVENGAKVGKGVEVAEVRFGDGSSDEELAAKQTELDRVARELRILRASVLPPGTGALRAEEYRRAATEAYLALCRLSAKGEYSAAAEEEERFLIALNRYRALTQGESFEAKLAEAEKTLASLFVGESSSVVNERASGIYYGAESIDGYETVFLPSLLETLTPSALAALAEGEPELLSEGMAVGKMTYGYSWHLALTLDASLSDAFEEGEQYEVSFPENNDRTLTLTLERTAREGDRLLLVLRSDSLPSDFVYHRAQSVQISLGTTKGYYIPSTALHTVDGVEGVYIFRDSILHFRQVEILYRGDGYCIASTGEKTELSLNDILVTSGKELYDGKGYT